MADIDRIIAVVQPKYSSNPGVIAKTLKEEGIAAAIEKAEPNPIWDNSIVYDSSAEQLEPVYFWILDFMQDMKFEVEKIVDNFAASPGGGYFAEMGARATKMQEEGMKIMQTVGILLKSLINLLYDLKEFEIRLKQYELAENKDPNEKEAAILALKQIWMDKVDMQRGRGSINAMAYELGFATLRDAFMTAKTVGDVDKMDLNDRVKKVLKPRVQEFFEWKTRSQLELKKRFEVEKSWLKSQVASLKSYTRWAKPYLKAAEQLMMKENKLSEPALVTAFNTMLLELTILCKKEIKVPDAVYEKGLPRSFKDLKMSRKYYQCVLIDFTFRSIPQRVSQQGHYAFGGRVDVKFKAFTMNEDELKVFDGVMKKQDFQDALKLVSATTDESLLQLADDIEHFLKEEKEEKKKSQGFMDLIFGKKSKVKSEEELKKEKEEKEKKGKKEPTLDTLKKDSFEESIVRMYAEQQVAGNCFKVYDIYKKGHGMASFAEPIWEYPSWKIPVKG